MSCSTALFAWKEVILTSYAPFQKFTVVPPE